MKASPKHYNYSVHRGGKSAVVCRVPSRLGAETVRKIAVALSKSCHAGVSVSNPTLVHHGKAAKASHHIVTGDASRSAIADLYYVGDDTARKIAQAIANATKLNLLVLDNSKLVRDLESHPRTFVDKSKRAKRNPSGKPTPGEVWTTLGGGKCKVLSVSSNQVQVLHTDTGNREWIELREFLSSYRLRARRTHNTRKPAKRKAKPRRKKPAPRANKRSVRATKGGRHKRKGKRNPSPERERAKRTFRMWHEFDASRVVRMKGPDRTIPKTLVKLGDLVSVVYKSDKYTGKPTLYEHKTKRPHPVLAADPDGRHVHIVGGRMRITGDGLVN